MLIKCRTRQFSVPTIEFVVVHVCRDIWMCGFLLNIYEIMYAFDDVLAHARNEQKKTSKLAKRRRVFVELIFAFHRINIHLMFWCRSNSLPLSLLVVCSDHFLRFVKKPHAGHTRSQKAKIQSSKEMSLKWSLPSCATTRARAHRNRLSCAITNSPTFFLIMKEHSRCILICLHFCTFCSVDGTKWLTDQ